jgi:hypothetical protein
LLLILNPDLSIDHLVPIVPSLRSNESRIPVVGKLEELAMDNAAADTEGLVTATLPLPVADASDEAGGLTDQD